MARTSIEWSEQSWNPVVGCSVHSPGCTNCYAMTLAARLERMGTPQYRGLTQSSRAGAVWTGEVRLVESQLFAPMRRRKPSRYFVNSMSDLFHEGLTDEQIDRVFAVMALCPQHVFQVLTKRSARMRAYLTGAWRRRVAFLLGQWAAQGVTTRMAGAAAAQMLTDHYALPYVWLGVSTEDQPRADKRVPDLLATPAAIRFVSAEPLLGPIDYRFLRVPHPVYPGVAATLDALIGQTFDLSQTPIGYTGPGLDLIIVGGESGRHARPMIPDGPRAIRDQCAATGTAFFFKQWGEFAWASEDKSFDEAARHARLCFGKSVNIQHFIGGQTAIRVGKKRAGRLLDGRLHDAMPEMRTW